MSATFPELGPLFSSTTLVSASLETDFTSQYVLPRTARTIKERMKTTFVVLCAMGVCFRLTDPASP